MKKFRSLVAVVTTLASSLAAAQSYTVVELPAKRVIKGASVYMAVPTAGLDNSGRSLVYGHAFFDDGRHVLRGEHCNAAGTKCSLLTPKDVDNGWNTLSFNGRFRGGAILTGPGVVGDALRQEKGESTEHMFCCGESRAINNFGVVAGVSDNASTAWFFDTERHVLPGLQGGRTQAAGIADTGLIVGESQTVAGERRAVAWQAGGGSPYLLQTGIPDGLRYESRAIAVTSAGVAYGTSNYLPNHSSATHAVRFEGGGVFDLGALPGQSNTSEALAVNNHGIAVGWSTNGSGPTTATLFDGLGNAFDLTTLIPEEDRAKYYVVQFATAINDAGQILVVAMKNVTFETVTLRLDPVATASR